MTRAIAIRTLCREFVAPSGTVPALSGIDLDVEKGEFVTLLGASGAGKSTLLRCMNGLVAPSSGSVHMGGLSVSVPAELKVIRERTGMIFQQYNLVRRLSVLQNVLCGRLAHCGTLASILRLFPGRDVELARRCLARVGLADKADSRADRLSGGQQQRVGIARALAQQPDIILADETVSSLDPRSARLVLEILKDINEQDGITVVVSLHNMQLAREFGSRVVGMKDGVLVFDSLMSAVDDAMLRDLYGEASDER